MATTSPPSSNACARSIASPTASISAKFITDPEHAGPVIRRPMRGKAGIGDLSIPKMLSFRASRHQFGATRVRFPVVGLGSYRDAYVRAVDHFSEMQKRSICLSRRNSERKTVAHFSWNCSRGGQYRPFGDRFGAGFVRRNAWRFDFDAFRNQAGRDRTRPCLCGFHAICSGARRAGARRHR